MTAPKREISALLPHSGGMVLIAEPYAELENGVRASIYVAEDSLFFEPGHGVPGWVGIEYMAQAVALHAGLVASRHGREIKIGFLLGTRRYGVDTNYFRLGARLTVEASEIWQDGHMAVYACILRDDEGRNLASAELNVYQPEDPKAFLLESDK